MPSSYSTNLRITLIQNGEQTGLWGDTTNQNLGTLIEDAISGMASVFVTSTKQALIIQDGAPDEARCAAIELTTSLSANFSVYVPPVTKLYVVKNDTAYTATVYCSNSPGSTTALGSGAAIPAGKTALLRSDGTNITDQVNHITGNFSVAGNASVTGSATISGNANVSGNAAISGNASVTGNTSVGGTTTLLDDLILGGSSGTAGQVVVSQGAGNPPIWAPAFVTGMIMMWSGTIATVPTGWLLCDGSNGTPDLRNRFIVGAGVDSAGQAQTDITGSTTKTGGSKDAVVVSHTHSATVNDPGHNHVWGHGTEKDDSSSGSSYREYTLIPGSDATVIQVNTTGITVTNSTAGVSGTNANLPPYYALAFIMKS